MRKEPGKAPDWTPRPSPPGRIGVTPMRAGRAVLVELEQRVSLVEDWMMTLPVHRAGGRRRRCQHPATGGMGRSPAAQRSEQPGMFLCSRREPVPVAARCGAEAVPEPALRERSGLRTGGRASQALYSNRGGLA